MRLQLKFALVFTVSIETVVAFNKFVPPVLELWFIIADPVCVMFLVVEKIGFVIVLFVNVSVLVLLTIKSSAVVDGRDNTRELFVIVPLPAVSVIFPFVIVKPPDEIVVDFNEFVPPVLELWSIIAVPV